MNLVNFYEPVSILLRKSAGGRPHIFEPYKVYVVSGQQLGRMMADENVNKCIFKISQFDSRIPNFHIKGRKLGPQTLLFYNGCGGYGDQIMAWPVVKLLSEMGFETHILTEPGNDYCWWGFPWVKSVLTLPMEMEIFKLFTYHVVFEYLANFDEHPGQLHPLDCMFDKIGIEHNSVDPQMKRVKPTFNRVEMGQAIQLKKDRKIGIYQLATSQDYRSLPVDQSVFILKLLATTFKDVHWMAIYDEFNPKGYKEAAEELKLENVEVKQFEYIRSLWALASMAEVVIAPDSMMIHVAGMTSVPCIGLWGPTRPATRMKYYDRQITIFHPESCPVAPCHYSGGGFPKYCPRIEGQRKQCDAMMAIQAEEVVEAAKKILHDPATRNGDSNQGDRQLPR